MIIQSHCIYRSLIRVGNSLLANVLCFIDPTLNKKILYFLT